MRAAPAAGWLEVTFRDGARFESSGESDLLLKTEAAVVAPTPGDPTHYLRGTLEAKLRHAAGEVLDLAIHCL